TYVYGVALHSTGHTEAAMSTLEKRLLAHPGDSNIVAALASFRAQRVGGATGPRTRLTSSVRMPGPWRHSRSSPWEWRLFSVSRWCAAACDFRRRSACCSAELCLARTFSTSLARRDQSPTSLPILANCC